MTGLFAYFTRPTAPIQFAGAAFLLGSILMGLSLWLTYRTLHDNTNIT
jgi:DHA1 family tetracycline resistance protein-like MFS transporter